MTWYPVKFQLQVSSFLSLSHKKFKWNPLYI